MTLVETWTAGRAVREPVRKDFSQSASDGLPQKNHEPCNRPNRWLFWKPNQKETSRPCPSTSREAGLQAPQIKNGRNGTPAEGIVRLHSHRPVRGIVHVKVCGQRRSGHRIGENAAAVAAGDRDKVFVNRAVARNRCWPGCHERVSRARGVQVRPTRRDSGGSRRRNRGRR